MTGARILRARSISARCGSHLRTTYSSPRSESTANILPMILNIRASGAALPGAVTGTTVAPGPLPQKRLQRFPARGQRTAVAGFRGGTGCRGGPFGRWHRLKPLFLTMRVHDNRCGKSGQGLSVRSQPPPDARCATSRPEEPNWVSCRGNCTLPLREGRRAKRSGEGQSSHRDPDPLPEKFCTAFAAAHARSEFYRPSLKGRAVIESNKGAI